MGFYPMLHNPQDGDKSWVNEEIDYPCLDFISTTAKID